ncbi:MAG TPA: class I SAM-dependent methyltransferase [Bacteroidia bacterium]|nr:class I SAM-dependent methyltransferase [Bacteroidia bacterium]
MINLIKKYYKERNAEEYEDRRKGNQKWKFEENTLRQVMEKYGESIETVLDIPIGTGRSLDILLKLKNISISGVDLSNDMMELAKARDTSGKVQFFERDIFSNELFLKADFVLCYRFLNLIDWTSAQIALKNLLRASHKYVLFTIRTIPVEYKEPVYIEDKIHLHFQRDVVNVIESNQFEIVNVFDFKDDRAGDYKIILCERADQIISGRLNKNKRMVYTLGRENKNTGKIYEIQNAAHGQFINYICSESPLSSYFPRINSLKDEFIEAEWVNGTLMEPKDWDKALNLLFDINELKVSHNSSFDYVSDLVIPRFLKAAPIIGKEFCDEIVRVISLESKGYNKKLSHPDLIPGNILNADKGPVIIDNELLCYSIHYRIDILNMLYNLPLEIRGVIAEKYLVKNNLESSVFIQEEKYLSALWLARLTGSLIIKGKVKEVFRVLSIYKNNQNILPFDFFKKSNEQK